MHLPPDFKFSDIPEAQAEGERRAAVIFGDDWRTEAYLQNKGKLDNVHISANDWSLLITDKLSFTSCLRGRKQDLPDGSPSRIDFHPNGRVDCIVHFFADASNDPPDGSPAVCTYSVDGTVLMTAHWRNGKHIDPADGLPSTVNYDEHGAIISAFDSTAARISPEDVNKMIAADQVRRVAALLDKAGHAVVPSGMPAPENQDKPAAAVVDRCAPSLYL